MLSWKLLISYKIESEAKKIFFDKIEYQKTKSEIIKWDIKSKEFWINQRKLEDIKEKQEKDQKNKEKQERERLEAERKLEIERVQKDKELEESKLRKQQEIIEREKRKKEDIILAQQRHEEAYKQRVKEEILEKERLKKLEAEAIQELISQGHLSKDYGIIHNRENIPNHVKEAVWKRDLQSCRNCGSKKKIEFDHIIPVSKGGANSVNNIQLLCQDCNRRKSNNITFE